ncbi:MAG: thioredoxin family protein [Kiritimatiellia bacterium]|nr:thioredoxin family protein [Kiritimatiellia bacterium]
MKKRIWNWLATLAVASLPAITLGAEVGQAAPAFTLSGLDGGTYSLESFRGKTVVLEWINHDCPFVKKHYESGNLPALQKEFAGKGVIWLAIGSSAPGKQGHFTSEVWKQRNEAVGFAAKALLLDPEGVAGRAYGARTTPHMFIINPEGLLVYAGALDDKPSANPKDIEGSVNYVRKALEEVLAGKPVSTPSTRAYGCSVKF